MFYHREGETIYHVDIAIYSAGTENSDGKSRLAKGKKNSAEEHRIWEVSDPQGLADMIFARFEGNDRGQFRRVVRYLKRWKDENFPSDGNAAPLGIGLTVAAYNDLRPTYTDVVAGRADDLEALQKLVRAILNRFMWSWDSNEGKLVHRLVVTLPVEPGNDLFGQMTNLQMEELKQKLEKLLDALGAASTEVDPHEACKELRKVFGEAFPVPEKKDTGKRHAPAIVSSSSSA